ncbi:Multidrug resistance protein MdtA precursor [Mucisphaera calidilacus]|uniref:Multidrug resistance protein MdtA n=2 Tax=Mucisphaera calidilacus TaxID=2527982 RepID=A0A518BWA1_9BACT|nr:Multidrug resistance protein MdtA precursor [Mucisphaera calidilacus]
MQGPPPAEVLVGTVTRAELQRVQELTGRLREVKRARVSAEVEGKIVELPVSTGDKVIAGETLLARIDGIWAELDLQAAEASIESIEVSLERARRDLEQLEQLRKTRSAVEKEVEDQRSSVKSLEAQLNAAKAVRDRTRQSVSRVNVYAPFDGRVTAKLAEIGEWATVGADIVEIVSSGQVDARIDVPEQLVGYLTAGQRIEVVVDTLEQPLIGLVDSIAPDTSNAARTYPVEIRLDDLDGRLLVGMSVVARIPIGEPSEVLLVPRDAVQFGTGTPTVWVAFPQEGQPMPMAMPVVVQILYPTGDRYAVRPAPGGPPMPGPLLDEGYTVVTQGAEWLFPTRPLITIPDETAGTSTTPNNG